MSIAVNSLETQHEHELSKRQEEYDAEMSSLKAKVDKEQEKATTLRLAMQV